MLLAKANAFRDQSGSAESIYLLGRITYGYSGTQGVMATRRSFREAKELIELALTMDEKLANGNAKALLGYFYVGLPGWPLSFGDVDRGLEKSGTCA